MTNRLPILYKVLVSQMQPAPSRGMNVRFAFYSISVRFQIKTYSAAETFVDIFAHFFFIIKQIIFFIKLWHLFDVVTSKSWSCILYM